MGVIDGSKGQGENHEGEADAVVTSVMLGFCAAEVKARHNIVIGYGEEADKAKHQVVKRKLAQALGYRSIEYIKMVPTPSYKGSGRSGGSGHRAITGAVGGQGQRDIQMSPKAMRMALDLQANTQGVFKQFKKLGMDKEVAERGAYYGIVDHPTEERLISTTRRLIPYDRAEGKRWNSGQPAQGMIGGQMKFHDPKKNPWNSMSMAALDTPFERRLAGGNWPKANEGVVGYCHGMNMAIMHCALLGGGTPYEVAVGTATTKLASCFGCTTFMYATDAPPSCIHFGKAESWVPIPINSVDNPDYNGNQIGIIDGLHRKWADTVATFLTEGVEILARKGATPYKRMAPALRFELKKRKNNLDRANIFLDALTVHKSEWARLTDALPG
jgi:hypothetical protein